MKLDTTNLNGLKKGSCLWSEEKTGTENPHSHLTQIPLCGKENFPGPGFPGIFGFLVSTTDKESKNGQATGTKPHPHTVTLKE